MSDRYQTGRGSVLLYFLMFFELVSAGQTQNVAKPLTNNGLVIVRAILLYCCVVLLSFENMKNK